MEVEQVSDVGWRRPTGYKLKVLSRLLSVGFAGRDVLAEQVDICWVRTADDCGCLDFTVPDLALRADVVSRIPVELHGAIDRDGLPLEILLFVADGRLESLEFVRYGGDANLYPEPEELEVLVRDPDGALRAGTE